MSLAALGLDSPPTDPIEQHDANERGHRVDATLTDGNVPRVDSTERLNEHRAVMPAEDLASGLEEECDADHDSCPTAVMAFEQVRPGALVRLFSKGESD